LKYVGDSSNFEQKWSEYESTAKTILPFYNHLGLLHNHEVSNGLLDYEALRQQVLYKIKH